MVNIVERAFDIGAANNLASSGLPNILARVLAARGIRETAQLDVTLARLIPPERLTKIGRAS